MINFFKDALEIVIQIALIVGVLSIIYVVFWSAAFYPVTKNRKHKQKVFEMEKKYNKIEVEHAAKIRLKETTDEKLRQTLYILAQKEARLEVVEKTLEKIDKEKPKKVKE